MNPLVSVIIPAFNAEQTIERAVRSGLAQSFADIEILVIDDASVDSTREIVEGLAREDKRVRLLRNDGNMGVANSRNRGFDEAKGEYAALLDADDEWLPEKLERQLAFIANAGCDICCTSYFLMDSEGRSLGKTVFVPDDVSFNLMLRKNVIGASTAVFKTGIVSELRMRSDFMHEDYVFWLEALKTGYTARGLNEPLMRYCFSESGRSHDKRNAAKERWKVYRRYLGYSWLKSAHYFLIYAAHGIRKYYR